MSKFMKCIIRELEHNDSIAWASRSMALISFSTVWSGVSSLMWIDDAFRDRDFHTPRVNPIGNEALDEPRLKLKGNAMVDLQRSFVWPHELRWHRRQPATNEKRKKKTFRPSLYLISIILIYHPLEWLNLIHITWSSTLTWLPSLPLEYVLTSRCYENKNRNYYTFKFGVKYYRKFILSNRFGTISNINWLNQITWLSCKSFSILI